MQIARPRRAITVEVDEEPVIVTWRSLAPTFVVAALITLAVAVFAVGWGTVRIAPATTLAVLLDHLPFVSTGEHADTTDAIIWQVRAPRVVLAGLVGAALGLSGASYQAVFRNPLAEPYLIGVAGGAAAGSTIVLVSPLAVSAWFVSPLLPAAFAGALIAVALSYSLARVAGRVRSTSLILAGVAVSSVCTSLVTFLMLTYTTRTLAVLNWVLGGFNTASWKDASIGAPAIIAAGLLILPYARILNVLQLDEDEARHLGVNVSRVKLVVLALASLATAAAVAVSGLIGFVGLIVPHAVRLVFGADYRRLLPLSAFAGASFLILADVAARSIDPGYELPIGVVTAMTGAPFFLYLLRRQSIAREVMD